jgi:hypothetical protein
VTQWIRALGVPLALLALPTAVRAQNAQNDDASVSPETVEAPVLPASVPASPVTPDHGNASGVRWKPLLNQALRFLLIENAFRYATEAGTRDPDLPYFRGYLNAVGNLHGWADGDPFYVNYVGHPMQGAVSGFIWIANDPRYRSVEFGRSRDYWRSRLRAAAFAWAYSEWTEIGPLISEAAIGNIQAFHPQQGFVDHVATPAVGLGWLIAEDAMDRYLVRFVERKTQNRYARILVRGAANPSRSFANVIGGQLPWARARDIAGETVSAPKAEDAEAPPGVAPFELAANAYMLAAPGGICAGGGATAAFRVGAEWQIVLDVNGCKMAGLETNLSGDSLSYMVGPRWTPPLKGRLVPYVQVLLGGNKLTQQLIFPARKVVIEELPVSTLSNEPAGWAYQQYSQQFERDGFAVSPGIGLDLKFNRALAFRLFDLEYTHSWAAEVSGFHAPNGLQIKTGVVLHMGNW